MENKLRRLLDFQKFQQNNRLSKMAADAEDRLAKSLSDEELSRVSAAGEPVPPKTEDSADGT